MSAAHASVARLPSTAAFGALAGVVLFFLVFDPRLLDPGYWIWLMEGDPATQYLGWRFFRAEPWHWPPGMIRSYGLDQSRIKDLRTNYEVGNTQAVLDGDLDGFIEASLKQGV